MIYAISDGLYVKIGFSKRPYRRMRNLQTGNPRQLSMLRIAKGTMREERILQDMFRPYHYDREWYTISPKFLTELDYAFDSILSLRAPANSAIEQGDCNESFRKSFISMVTVTVGSTHYRDANCIGDSRGVG